MQVFVCTVGPILLGLPGMDHPALQYEVHHHVHKSKGRLCFLISTQTFLTFSDRVVFSKAFTCIYTYHTYALLATKINVETVDLHSEQKTAQELQQKPIEQSSKATRSEQGSAIIAADSSRHTNTPCFGIGKQKPSFPFLKNIERWKTIASLFELNALTYG